MSASRRLHKGHAGPKRPAFESAAPDRAVSLGSTSAPANVSEFANQPKNGVLPIRLAQLALDVVSGPFGARAAARPGFPPAGRGAGPLRVRGGSPPLPRGVPAAGSARLDPRRALVA